MKQFGIAVIAFGIALFTHTPTARAVVSESGSVSVNAGSVVATHEWLSGNFTLAWEISQLVDGGDVTYEYTLNVPSKDLSHWILELCPTLDENDVVLSTDHYEEAEFNTFGPGPGNPGMGGSFYGVKFDDATGTGLLIFTLVTDRLPTDGSFYAKDGGGNGDGAVYAYNTGLANVSGAFIRTPGCEQVPEPTGFILTAAGVGPIRCHPAQAELNVRRKPGRDAPQELENLCGA